MSYDPNQPTLISMGLLKLGSDWNGRERRRTRGSARNNGKFIEVKLPTYESNDSKIRIDGLYPAGV